MLSTFKALADPTRLRLLAVLVRGEYTVQELTSIVDMGQSRVSRHLKILTDAGLLSVKRQGTWAYYRLVDRNQFFSDIRPLIELRLNQDILAISDRERLLAVLENRRCKSLDFFETHARQWDKLVRDSLPTADYQDLLLQSVPDLQIALEVGVGTGNLLEGLRHRVEMVVGVDHSPVMLEQARQRIMHSGLNGIELRLGELRHLPVSDNEVQWVVLNMVLHHAALPQQVFCELARVLAPGGGITLADLHRHEHEWVRDVLADQWLGFERTELEGWLLSAGFELTSFQIVSGVPSGHDVVLVSAVKKHPSAHGALL